ncbi:exopolyphosphatase/guanosine-5'-triphosphate,3'-diphosphate pyrophosphatase [Williamsia limnetica]|uniref:Exopolyphosphatase/guanosine-5'-triphosphate, 3'-diphosphate pyrophosphatase n=1 Tax=Williamsia limnetica TaxID=882452 RepID=A0A318RPV5_WILLI|nr:Ppx/GppA phosphatase family protein [Williamsia limnetica]PYE19126.1 exopolyphosphatase/guanosine-5'-triphosphate,3'-diphosphate pyrophosphatase [Williamsia limnetica]
MTEIVAAVDCGTNSIRLLVARAGDSGLVDLHREMRVVRLGQGVDATGSFADEAIERTRVALADYVATMKQHGVTAVRMVATSASRDAANRDEFFAMTRDLLGQVVPGTVAEVITGDEEARLSFAGAVGDLDQAEGPFVVVDLGGGSTEVVFGDVNGVHAAYSANIGCVRLTERCLHSDPPTDEEIAAARSIIEELLGEAFSRVQVDGARTLVGVAGTMTTLAALAADLPDYDPELIHLSRVDFGTLADVCRRLVRMPRSERAALGPMHEGRVDVIGGGSLITLELARIIAEKTSITELVVSEHDILDGIALSLLADD